MYKIECMGCCCGSSWEACVSKLGLLKCSYTRGWLEWITNMLGAQGQDAQGWQEMMAGNREGQSGCKAETFRRWGSRGAKSSRVHKVLLGCKICWLFIIQARGSWNWPTKPLWRVVINCCVLCYHHGCNDQVWIALIRLGMIWWALKSWCYTLLDFCRN